MYISQRFPPHLQYVATLPCENLKSKNVTDFNSILFVFDSEDLANVIPHKEVPARCHKSNNPEDSGLQLAIVVPICVLRKSGVVHQRKFRVAFGALSCMNTKS